MFVLFVFDSFIDMMVLVFVMFGGMELFEVVGGV